MPSSTDLISSVFVAQDKLAVVPAGAYKLVILDMKTGERTDLLSAFLVNWAPSRITVFPQFKS